MILYKTYCPGEINHILIFQMLREVDDYFIPSLSSRTDINEYSKKIALNAVSIVATSESDTIGFISFYYTPGTSYITMLCVKKEYQGQSIGHNLLSKAINYCKELGSKEMKTIMRKTNVLLLKFYTEFEFKINGEGNYPNSNIEYLLIQKAL